MKNKPNYIEINGQQIPVTEEIYRTYRCPAMKENTEWKDIPFSEYPIVKRLGLEPTNRRWKKERIYTDGDKFYHKDSLHGEVEVYNSRKKHIGVLTAEGDEHPKKGKVKGRVLYDK